MKERVRSFTGLSDATDSSETERWPCEGFSDAGRNSTYDFECNLSWRCQ